ncbi:MAG: hypothetical protein AAGJ97_14830, partial [Planctomycetota bacterium]
MPDAPNGGDADKSDEKLDTKADYTIEGPGLEKIMKHVGTLLDLQGVKLPDGTDGASLAMALDVLVPNLTGAETTDPSDTAAPPSDPSAMMSQSLGPAIAKAVSDAVGPLTERLGKIEGQQAAMLSQSAGDAKARFEA